MKELDNKEIEKLMFEKVHFRNIQIVKRLNKTKITAQELLESL